MNAPVVKILGTRIDPTDYDAATAKIIEWAKNSKGRYVCAANAHMVMEAYDSVDFRELVNAADLVTPDGMPLVWALRRLGHPDQARVYGPDLTLEVVATAAADGIPVGLYGGTPEALQNMVGVFQTKYPRLQIPYTYSPPFRPLTSAEDAAVIEAIQDSGVKILFVGLGCPKQERWMAGHCSKMQVVMIGVGAAFDYYSGTRRQAPRWLQNSGLEWLFRLVQEPKRLWRRYLYHNPRFAYLILRQIFLQNL